MDDYGVGNVASYVLVDIIDGWRARGESPQKRAAAQAELERRHPCRDCGAPAGRPCKPEYGCLPSLRLPEPQGVGRTDGYGGHLTEGGY